MKKDTQKTNKKNKGPGKDLKIFHFATLSVCNLRCVFCAKKETAEAGEYLPTAYCKKALKKQFNRGFRAVCFDGGEPTMRDDLPVLLKYSDLLGYRQISIITNGILISEKENIRKILSSARSERLEFSISFHSHDAKIYEKMVGVKGSFSKLLRATKNLHNLCGQNISLYHVITSYNYDKLESFVDFVHKMFPKIKLITFSYPFPSGEALRHKEIFPRFSSVGKKLVKAMDLCCSYGIDTELTSCGYIPLCVFPKYRKELLDLYIKEDSDAILSMDTRSSFTFKESFRSVSERQMKPSKCSACMYNKICRGIWKIYADKFGLKEFKPIRRRSIWRR